MGRRASVDPAPIDSGIFGAGENRRSSLRPSVDTSRVERSLRRVQSWRVVGYRELRKLMADESPLERFRG